MKKEVAIYALCEPDGETVRYIGSTTSPKGRFGQHLADARRRVRTLKKPNPKRTWLRKLREDGERPVMKVLEWCANDQRGEREDWWINHYRERGAALTNGKNVGRKNYPIGADWEDSRTLSWAGKRWFNIQNERNS